MPKRTDLHKILIIGSGPIVIGQACEFDYSGTQACKALREEGYEVVLVNSNPATIMTDPELADRTYIEPLTFEILSKILERERPQALLPTVGGQTSLNLAVELSEKGVLERLGVKLIGANDEAVRVSEDRQRFKRAMQEIGLEVPQSAAVHSPEEAEAAARDLGYPLVIRPSFTLGGSGGGIAYNVEELERVVKDGLDRSPINQVLVEESVIGWKEYELEVMRDLKDNVVIICSIENLDPMGVHTGDSITVAPSQTLSDQDYQRMRDAAIRVIRAVGVETGGSNIQFAVHPKDGRMVVIEMNPRVSRSSALASKATGFPIAKIAAKLAVGYTLDEIPNDITRVSTSAFEPTIDYVVVKIPRWNFEKFPNADPYLGVQMKSVGEAMSIGRTFREALQKGIRSLEIGRYGFGADGQGAIEEDALEEGLKRPNAERLFYLHQALASGWKVEDVAALTQIDPWFLNHLKAIVEEEESLQGRSLIDLSAEEMLRHKRSGFSDIQLAHLTGSTESRVLERRKELGVKPVFKRVDTCGAEFEALTPYLYSTYEDECEARPTSERKVMILGGGPNRIGQGIEFDYCCCHASFALREEGFETIMVNCNPETVSTDYDTSSRLYFEPLTLEDVLHIVEVERPEGVIIQFGGQTPLNLALDLERHGVPILGTAPASIDLAEDREQFGRLLEDLDITMPRFGTASTREEARKVADEVGYPVLVRPSYVLGGRAMVIVHSQAMLDSYLEKAVRAAPGRRILIDRFLEDAFEVDVDAVSDGRDVTIGGIMQHIEEAGIHSGDSACVLPTYKIEPDQLELIRETTVKLARALKVVGLMNVQYAIRDGVLYVLEVNPRASRTVPFVSKAIGVPLAKVAARAMVGRSLQEQGFTREILPQKWFVKEVVLPFKRFPGEDSLLGPEMKSTGEVMSFADTFGHAFAKAQIASGSSLPLEGGVFISVNDNDKAAVVPIARGLAELGFRLITTRGTTKAFEAAGLETQRVFKVNEGRPNVVDHMKNGKIQLVINTPLGQKSYFDEQAIRQTAVQMDVPCITTLSGAAAAVTGIQALRERTLEICSLQECHRKP